MIGLAEAIPVMAVEARRRAERSLVRMVRVLSVRQTTNRDWVEWSELRAEDFERRAARRRAGDRDARDVAEATVERDREGLSVRSERLVQTNLLRRAVRELDREGVDRRRAFDRDELEARDPRVGGDDV